MIRQFYCTMCLVFMAIISQAQCGFVVSKNISNPTCFSVCDGSVDLVLSGGTSPYSFQWQSSLSASTSQISNLCAAIYFVTISDASPCSATESITIVEPNEITIATTVTNSYCKSKNGSIDMTINGGTMPYTFQWNSGHTAQNLAQLETGVYNLVVWDSKNCSKSKSDSVFSYSAVTLKYTKEDDICDLLGTISFSADSGTKPYTFYFDGSPANGITSYTNLQPASYELEVEDANQCTDTSNVTILDLECQDPIPDKAFSPNDDGLTDSWGIANINQYPNALIIVYDRWGQKVYTKKGKYDPPWDGKFDFKPLPAASYYYTIFIDKDDKSAGVVTGSVAIAR